MIFSMFWLNIILFQHLLIKSLLWNSNLIDDTYMLIDVFKTLKIGGLIMKLNKKLILISIWRHPQKGYVSIFLLLLYVVYMFSLH